MCEHKVLCTDALGRKVLRPCGVCPDCRKMSQSAWSFRLEQEVRAWDPSSVWFVTFKYDDAKLPYWVTHQDGTVEYYRGFDNIPFDVVDLSLRYKSLPQDIARVRDSQESYDGLPIACPSVEYSDINKSIRNLRKHNHIEVRSFRDFKVNCFLKDLSFKDIDGHVSSYPSSAYTPSFKYFITSEYGPRTRRPHYHAIFFGLGEIDMLALGKYWVTRYGDGKDLSCTNSFSYSLYDSSRGGAYYLGKYASKGVFENPYCSKVFLNKDNTCTVSRDFSYNVHFFGINQPLCAPTFHLISKGIGIRYPFNSSIQRYWRVRCDESTNFVTEDIDILPQFPYYDFLDVARLSLVSNSREIIDIDDLPVSFNVIPDNDSYKLATFNSCGRVVGRSYVNVSRSLASDEFKEFCKQFSRKSIMRFSAKTQKVTPVPLCSFYRRFLLSPASSAIYNLGLLLVVSEKFKERDNEYRHVRPLGERAVLDFLKSYEIAKDIRLSCQTARLIDDTLLMYSYSTI